MRNGTARLTRGADVFQAGLAQGIGGQGILGGVDGGTKPSPEAGEVRFPEHAFENAFLDPKAAVVANTGDATQAFGRGDVVDDEIAGRHGRRNGRKSGVSAEKVLT